MTTQITQLKDTLARDTDRITRQAQRAMDALKELQGAIVEGLTKGYAVSVGNLERLLEQEQVARVWSQVDRLASTASDTQELKARLEEWYRDAVAQAMAPGRSHSTSLVRTAQLMAEEDALKSVARTVAAISENVGL